jgi:predicted TIM-barrel fold metal-dependent hydrolase
LDAEVGGKTSISKQKKIRILEENEGNQKLMFGTDPNILLLEIPSDAHLRTSKKIKLLQQHHQTSSTISNIIIFSTRLSLTSSKELELNS